MFKRLKCKQCNEKISKRYTYCPHCGFNQKDEAPQNFFEPAFKLGFPFNKLFQELEKQLEGQFRELDSQIGEEFAEGLPPSAGISINIDNVNGQPTIRIKSMDDKSNKENAAKKECNNPNHHHHHSHSAPSATHQLHKKVDEARVEKFSNLPREEPNTKVRRLTNKLVYEINLPGVKNEDIMISKLENSIEVKAFSDDKAFFKLIPLSLPILGSELKEGVLNLELKL